MHFKLHIYVCVLLRRVLKVDVNLRVLNGNLEIKKFISIYYIQCDYNCRSF